MPTANDIQKERKRLLEEQAAEGFHDIYFVSSKRSKLNGKVAHFENNDKASVCYSLGGDVLDRR